MGKLFRENVALLVGSAGLVFFVIIGIFSFDEWLAGDTRYLKYGALALLWLGIGLFQLRRWRQQQVRM